MKRLLSLTLVLMLVLLCTVASAFDRDYTLSEKLQRQLDYGSGFKGTLTVEASGSAPWAAELSRLNGVNWEIRALSSGGQFQYQLYAPDGEAQVALTQVWGNADKLCLGSDLLDGTVVTLPLTGNLLDSVLGADSAVASWYPVALQLMDLPQTTWNNSWAEVVEPYYAAIELWLANFASAPAVTRGEDSNITITVRYTLTDAALREEMTVLLDKALHDTALLTLLRGQMDEAQADVYLNPYLLPFYTELIGQMKLEGNVELERVMTARGDTLSTVIRLPLNGSDGWSAFEWTQNGEDIAVSLQGSERTLTLQMKANGLDTAAGTWAGTLLNVPASPTEDDPARAFSFHVARTYEERADEDGREHEITRWAVAISDAADHLPEGIASVQAVEPIALTAELHFHSMSNQKKPTTLEADVSLSVGDSIVRVVLNSKTTNPWILPQLPEDGEDVMTMSPERRTELLTRWTDGMLSAASTLSGTIPLPEDTPVQDAAPDEPAADETPDAEESAEADETEDAAEPDETEADEDAADDGTIVEPEAEDIADEEAP